MVIGSVCRINQSIWTIILYSILFTLLKEGDLPV
jgi:hypothetical protein